MEESFSFFSQGDKHSLELEGSPPSEKVTVKRKKSKFVPPLKRTRVPAELEQVEKTVSYSDSQNDPSANRGDSDGLSSNGRDENTNTSFPVRRFKLGLAKSRRSSCFSLGVLAAGNRAGVGCKPTKNKATLPAPPSLRGGVRSHDPRNDNLDVFSFPRSQVQDSQEETRDKAEPGAEGVENKRLNMSLTGRTYDQQVAAYMHIR